MTLNSCVGNFDVKTCPFRHGSSIGFSRHEPTNCDVVLRQYEKFGFVFFVFDHIYIYMGLRDKCEGPKRLCMRIHCRKSIFHLTIGSMWVFQQKEGDKLNPHCTLSLRKFNEEDISSS